MSSELERFLEMGLAGEIRLFISDAIMEETLGVLEEKFQVSPSEIAAGEGIDFDAVDTSDTYGLWRVTNR